MMVRSQTVLLWLLLGAVFLSPVAVGAFEAWPAAAIGGVFLVFAIYATGSRRRRWSVQVTLVLLSVCLAVTIFDLVARPLLASSVRPADRFIRRWEDLPLLKRYVPSVNYEGPTYGDLAAVARRSDLRVWRRIRFVTDEYGFRNEPPAPGAGARPLDVIVLGDSFGVAAGTSQEEILCSQLARNFGLSTYNLSISREGPQQEYANLVLENQRLPVREGTCVLWLIFTGNDLDDPHYPELENPRPVRPPLLTRLANGISDFRSRSPVRRLLSRGGAKAVIEKTFLDGRPVLFEEAYARRSRRTDADVLRHPNFPKLEVTFGAMERLAGERHLSVAVVLVPGKEEVYAWLLDGAPPWSSGREPSGLSTVMRGLCGRHGFRYLDLKPALVEASAREYGKSGGLLWWHDDTHWNGPGQRTAAEVIHEALLRATPTP
jgi:hypothetical protein